MDSITIGWNKHSSGNVEVLPNKQCLQQDSTEKQTNKSSKKKVHFSLNSFNVKQQEFESNTEQYVSKNDRIQRLSSEDYNNISSSSSSTNIFISQLPEVDDEPICSSRGIIVTFIIIVIIIIATAAAVGIVFGAIHRSVDTTQNTSQSSFPTLSITVSTILLTSSVSIGSQIGAPCLSYTTIDDPSRNVMLESSRGCDRISIFNGTGNGAWIRFVGSGGLVMPSLSPGINHCGGFMTGWFNATLPLITGTMVNGSLCFDGEVFTCSLSYDTSAIYCTGNFYIYFLKPAPFCNSRYCTV